MMTTEAANTILQAVIRRHKTFKQIGDLHLTQASRHRVHFEPLTVSPIRVQEWFKEAGADTTMLGMIIENGQEREWYVVFEARR